MGGRGGGGEGGGGSGTNKSGRESTRRDRNTLSPPARGSNPGSSDEHFNALTTELRPPYEWKVDL